MRDASTINVLLADDDVSLRQFISMHLEQEGFGVVQAKDGIDAIVKLREALPNVVVSDLQMPRMSGIELLSVVRRRFPAIPLIMLAGALPKELMADITPDRCFEKSARKIPELMRAIHELVRETADGVIAPQAANPAHARLVEGGYVSVPCTDCLRIFQLQNPSANKAGVRSAVCTHCRAEVEFLIDGTASA